MACRSWTINGVGKSRVANLSKEGRLCQRRPSSGLKGRLIYLRYSCRKCKCLIVSVFFLKNTSLNCPCLNPFCFPFLFLRRGFFTGAGLRVGGRSIGQWPIKWLEPIEEAGGQGVPEGKLGKWIETVEHGVFVEVFKKIIEVKWKDFTVGAGVGERVAKFQVEAAIVYGGRLSDSIGIGVHHDFNGLGFEYSTACLYAGGEDVKGAGFFWFEVVGDGHFPAHLPIDHIEGGREVGAAHHVEIF